MNVWVSRYRVKILHAFGVVGELPPFDKSFCGRIALAKCDRTNAEPFEASKFGQKVDHCISCERRVERLRINQRLVEHLKKVTP